MNKLEKAIIDGVKIAQREYEDMTGWWLSHGPESFIMCTVARKVSKNNFSVFVEASPRKILKERGGKLRGRPPGNHGQRFDIVIWHRSSNKIRAIIEVKRAWNIAILRDDWKKISYYMAAPQSFVSAGYLLTYTEAKGKSRETTIRNRFAHWAEKLPCTLVGSFINKESEDDWKWAIGLFRL